MYNVVTSFGNYPSNIEFGMPGPFTAEELGLKWLAHSARFSKEGMLSKYRLILLLPRKVKIPESYNPYLDAWGAKIRFDENSGVNAWPLGPNLCMQQILWFYVHKKLSGPFLWCEPDCIPVKETWLDDLFEEYERRGKAFMGALVSAKSENGQHIPRHMTGNGIYPENAYLLAPQMLKSRMMPWDVDAAESIMANCHFTNQIQHEYRHHEIKTQREMYETLRPGASLFHTDKFGAIIRILGGEIIDAERHQSSPAQNPNTGKSLVEVFPQEDSGATFDLDRTLFTISEMCRLDADTRRKVAYFMLENGIINSGHYGTYKKRLKAKSINVETDGSELREVAT